MLKIKSDSKIYIMCPANSATGGPELLHQLVEKLIDANYNAFIYYKPQVQNPTPDRFKKYNINIANIVEDSKDNIIIAPETSTDTLYKYKNMRKVIWWLSIDNYFVIFNNANWKTKLKELIGIYKNYNINQDNNEITHLVQSYYAYDFLKKKGINNIDYLSDYINDLYLEGEVEYNSNNRENLCFYNPKKGVEFTRELIKQCEDDNIKFIPIQNMTVEQIRDLMRKGKTYIDFGNHPGKDRIPREAAISGCCVITNKKGSAKFTKDVPIDNRYKFDDDIKNIPFIIETINNCMNNYDEQIRNFEDYRDMIKKEKSRFVEDILNIF